VQYFFFGLSVRSCFHVGGPPPRVSFGSIGAHGVLVWKPDPRPVGCAGFHSLVPSLFPSLFDVPAGTGCVSRGTLLVGIVTQKDSSIFTRLVACRVLCLYDCTGPSGGRREVP